MYHNIVGDVSSDILLARYNCMVDFSKSFKRKQNYKKASKIRRSNTLKFWGVYQNYCVMLTIQGTIYSLAFCWKVHHFSSAVSTMQWPTLDYEPKSTPIYNSCVQPC